MGGGGGAGGGLAGCTVQAFATIDDFLPVGCALAKGRFVSAISTPLPQVIVAGELKCASQGIAVRSLGSDGGWELYDGQDGGPWSNPTLNGMVVSQGRVFLVGSDADPADGGPSTQGWRVWRKGLGPMDPMELVDSSPNGKATSAALSPAGDSVFVAGVREGQLVVRRWDGASWGDAFVDTFSPPGCLEEPRGIAMDSQGNLHVTGSRTADGGIACNVERPWFTMTLSNFGTQWDGGFVQHSGVEATAVGIAASPGTDVFTVGRTVLPGVTPKWFVYQSTTSGQTWGGSDVWQLLGPCIPGSVTATDNRTWVAGECTDDAGVQNWAVRSMRASQWSTADLWSRGGIGATASSVAVDAQETAYVAGFTKNGRWIVRSARCQ